MSEAHSVKDEVRIYMIVFGALMALTVITVAISYLKVSVAVAIVLALIVATIKASLVACYFMHLISEKKLIYMVLIFTVIFFAGLMYLPITESYNTPEGTVHLNTQHAPATAVKGHAEEKEHH